MTTATTPRRGQTWRVPLVTTTAGQLAKDVEVEVERVTGLTCGCHRIETTRRRSGDSTSTSTAAPGTQPMTTNPKR